MTESNVCQTERANPAQTSEFDKEFNILLIIN
jgi:hypothetical protein